MKRNIVEVLKYIGNTHTKSPIGSQASLIVQALDPVCNFDSSMLEDLAKIECIKDLVFLDDMTTSVTNLKVWLFDLSHTVMLHDKSFDEWLEVGSQQTAYTIAQVLANEDEVVYPTDSVMRAIEQVDYLSKNLDRDHYRDDSMKAQAIRSVATALIIVQNPIGTRRATRVAELNRKIMALMSKCTPEFNELVWDSVNEMQAPK